MNSQLPKDALSDFAQRPIALSVDESLRQAMLRCIDQRLTELPLPGDGDTLGRWQVLAKVAGIDLALLKLFEGHTDAVAILEELGASDLQAPGIWGVWAAEPPDARVRITERSPAGVRLEGRKAWCSGALQVDHALLTAWDEQDEPQLVAVKLDQPGVRRSEQGWQAVGMAHTASVDVHFDHAPACPVGASGEYLSRPGFWQGGAGIAAAWYGAAQALGEYLRSSRGRSDPHADAHLGAVDAALYGAASALRECAAWIDAYPFDNAQLAVQRVRAHVEAAVETVLHHVGRALGAGPYCRNPHFARLIADLPVFIRQSHAERDLAGLGRLVAAQPAGEWSL
ncbi:MULTISPECIES: acyl-CoA dehydrogenase [Pseudomonas]|uniref:acyl-CoA dehydrogenase n=1 Tax=Pseudomonas TaxID=286 RepID=UPI001CFB6956|nr:MULTISPECIES: acyl-CoA dehydrogenase [Pseudomonas]